MLCEKAGKRDSDTEWRILLPGWHLTAFLTTAADPSRSLRMTPDVFLIMTPFPPIVILNGDKNAVWESRETERWHRVKNLLPGWHLTVFFTTAADSSHSLRITINVSLIMAADPLLLFRMTPNGNHMLRLLTHIWRLTSNILCLASLSSYRFPPYGNRSFAIAQDDAWRFPHYDALSSNRHSERG